MKTLWVPKGTSVNFISVKLGLSDGTYSELLESPLKEGDPLVIEATTNSSPKPAGLTGASAPGGMRRMF